MINICDASSYQLDVNLHIFRLVDVISVAKLLYRAVSADIQPVSYTEQEAANQCWCWCPAQPKIRVMGIAGAISSNDADHAAIVNTD